MRVPNFHSNQTNSCCDISLKTINMNLMVTVEERYIIIIIIIIIRYCSLDQSDETT